MGKVMNLGDKCERDRILSLDSFMNLIIYYFLFLSKSFNRTKRQNMYLHQHLTKINWVSGSILGMILETWVDHADPSWRPMTERNCYKQIQRLNLLRRGDCNRTTPWDRWLMTLGHLAIMAADCVAVWLCDWEPTAGMADWLCLTAWIFFSACALLRGPSAES